MKARATAESYMNAAADTVVRGACWCGKRVFKSQEKLMDSILSNPSRAGIRALGERYANLGAHLSGENYGSRSTDDPHLVPLALVLKSRSGSAGRSGWVAWRADAYPGEPGWWPSGKWNWDSVRAWRAA